MQRRVYINVHLHRAYYIGSHTGSLGHSPQEKYIESETFLRAATYLLVGYCSDDVQVPTDVTSDNYYIRVY